MPAKGSRFESKTHCRVPGQENVVEQDEDDLRQRQLSGKPNDRNGLPTQPVDATPPILTDKDLKPMAFLRRGLATIRGHVSANEKDQETALLAISTDLTSTCCCVS